jgi:hypothetical protein
MYFLYDLSVFLFVKNLSFNNAIIFGAIQRGCRFFNYVEG